LFFVGFPTLDASPRTSDNYSIFAEVADAGGRRATSSSYTNDGSAGSIVGISTGTAPGEVVKHGYIGQLYEVTGFALTAHAPGMNETGSLQLESLYVLDDASHLAIAPASVTWSVVTGPITVTTDGIALAEIVYQNTPATARGTLGAFSDDFEMTVYDGHPDNYGTYAGDGIDDAWQFQYFGLNNPLAGPLLDPDGDGQTNRFEFTAGVVPTDPLSRFLLRIDPANLQPTHRHLIFSPVLADRTYSVEFCDSLVPALWTPLTGSAPIDNGNERTVTDTSATAPSKFYHVKVEKP